MKLNFMGIKDNIFRHRQIEKRDARIFMRIKKRAVVIIRQNMADKKRGDLSAASGAG